MILNDKKHDDIAHMTAQADANVLRNLRPTNAKDANYLVRMPGIGEKYRD